MSSQRYTAVTVTAATIEAGIPGAAAGYAVLAPIPVPSWAVSATIYLNVAATQGDILVTPAHVDPIYAQTGPTVAQITAATQHWDVIDAATRTQAAVTDAEDPAGITWRIAPGVTGITNENDGSSISINGPLPAYLTFEITETVAGGTHTFNIVVVWQTDPV